MGDPKSSSPTKTQGDDADKKPQQPVEDGVLLGLNEDGSTFVVPKLPDALETFIYPSQWNFSTLLTLLFSAATIFAGVSTESIYWAYTLSLFWRLMYNGFLGYILNVQSKSNGFTAAIERLERTPSTKVFLDKRLSKEIAASTLTVRSWAHFRLIATTVLDLDVVAFMCVVYRELADNFASDCDPDSLEHFCIPDFIAYPLGALLIVSSLYGKASAHRTLGHYAWFWGDFFFPVSGSLVFDGIFELFPHPMYTAGYAWMYGFALIVRSYALFALVIICHLLQMLFLSAVETPHIEKIYGKDEPATGKKERTSNFFAPKNFDFFRAGDLSSVLVALFFTGFCYLGVRWYPDIYTCGGTSQSYAPCVSPAAQASDESAPVSYFEMLGLGGESTCVLRGRTDYWCNTTDGKWGFCNCGHLSSTFFVVNALFWRFVQTGLSGLVLHNQAKSGFWMKHFAAKGVSQAEAFHNWIQVQNLLSTISYASFLAAAWYFFQWDEFTFFSAYGLTVILVSVCMMGVSMWTFQECYNVLGDFGWYYGDFFMENPRLKDESKSGLSYVGIYRYLNNPSTILGFLGFYAVALLCQSWTVASIAGVSQALHIFHLTTVEEPHMKHIYTSQVRKELAHLRQLKEKLAKAKVAAKRGIDTVQRKVHDAAAPIRRRRGSSS